MASKIRLHLDHPLAQGQTVPLTEAQAHYLFAVMRIGPGTVISVINSRDGEWDGAVTPAGKRGGSVLLLAQTAPLQMPPDLWLLFAPIKKARTDFIVEKAVEMGVARIVPVLTDYTNAERVRVDKLQAHAIEAAEQSGGTYVPQVSEPLRLSKWLDTWPADRSLWFCDETLRGTPSASSADPGHAAILIGPEGGFSDTERSRLRSLPYARAISLGPRILRADTAAVAALTLWQITQGDWR